MDQLEEPRVAASSRARSPGPSRARACPDSLTSIPGASVAWVTSITIAASGSSEKALVREPPKVVSSCTAATAASSHCAAAGLCHQPRRLERDEGAEPVVQRARGEPSVGQRRAARRRSPRRRRPAPSRAPARRRGRRCRCAGRGSRRPSCAPRRAAGGSASCRPRPRTGPALRVDHDALADQDLRRPSRRLPGTTGSRRRRCGSTIRPISSMWPITSRRRRARPLPPCAGATQRQRACRSRRCETCANSLGRVAATPPPGRLVPGGAAGAQQRRAGPRGRGGLGTRLARAAGACRGRSGSSGEQAAQHVLQDAAVAEVVGLAGRVDPHAARRTRPPRRPRARP